MSSHTEYGPLQSVFLKHARDAFKDQETLAGQWETLHYLAEPDFEKAIEEYQNFETLIREPGVEVHYFPADGRVSIDSIYCRDASIATDYGMILCNMGKAGRAEEPQAQRDFYEEMGLAILGEIKPPGTLEGGDMAWLDEKTLAVGHTYRTNKDGIQAIRAIIRAVRDRSSSGRDATLQRTRGCLSPDVCIESSG